MRDEWQERAATNTRTITCDTECCTWPKIVLVGEYSDDAVADAVCMLGWDVTLHESGDYRRDRHHCPNHRSNL